MNDIVRTFFLVYASLFPIVNPVGSAPIFLALTQGCTDTERRTLALHVAINGFLLLLGSLFVGSHVLEAFGITLPVVRVAGGLVVTAFGWKLLHADQELADKRDSAAAARPAKPREAFYPLTMPVTVGPGSISVAIALGSQRPKAADLAHIGNFLVLGAGAVLGLLAIAATCYVCYSFGDRMAKMLGPSGTSVVVRLSAFILLCIGIQILWNGYNALIGSAG